jgi:quercetin dioxygenase-like cupin family protein
MEFYSFTKESGRQIEAFDSDFVMSRIIQSNRPTHIGCMHLDQNGVVGFHQAVVPMLLLVLNGEGFVTTDQVEYIKVQAGDVVFWKKDEWHETKSEKGLTAIVVEGEDLYPASFMPQKNRDVEKNKNT